MTDTTRLQMREQMFKTMVALEGAAIAATAYFESMGRPAEPVESPPEPNEEIEQLGRVITKHHQALSILATFAEFKDSGFFGATPRGLMISMLGMRACSDCVGTGWLSRDEGCKPCRATGYIKS